MVYGLSPRLVTVAATALSGIVSRVILRRVAVTPFQKSDATRQQVAI
jgi:hypothetical protein